MSPIDKIIHERARLLILTYLASNEKKEISFNEFQEKLGFTSGNLSIQLKKLKEANYIEIHKTFKDNKPHTTIQVTAEGTQALNAYIDEMESIINALKRPGAG